MPRANSASARSYWLSSPSCSARRAVELRLQRRVVDAARRGLGARQQRVGMPLILVLAVEVGERQQHARAQRRVVGELALDGCFATSQQLRGRQGLVAAFLQQEGHEFVARLGIGKLPQRTVALVLCLQRGGHRALAFAAGPMRLPHRADDAGDDGEHGQRARGDSTTVPRRELAEPVRQRCRTCAHRLFVEKALQVIGQRRCRRVAIARRFAHRLGDDVVEVAGERLAQAVARRRALLRTAEQGRHARRFHIVQRAQQLIARCRPDRHGAAAGQQLVKQHAERVDVGRGGHRLAEQLLGRGVFGREQLRIGARQRRAVAGGFVFEQLGDAEIEQLDAAVVIDEHVQRLDVAMHDQVRVRVGDGREHVEEQADARFAVEPLQVAVAIDGAAFRCIRARGRVARRV